MRQPFLEKKRGLLYWRVPLFEEIGVSACFFTRQGGFSVKEFKSLNLGLNTEDDPDLVVSNRQKIINVCQWGPLLPVICNQVHGKRIRIVGKRNAASGWYVHGSAIKKTDGLITTVRGLPLAITTADCVPVLITSEKKPCIAAIHAGWRGIEQGIVLKAIEKILQYKGLSPSELRLAIGPAISPQYYEITGETASKLNGLYPKAIILKKNKGKYFFDLWKAILIQCGKSGVSPSKISIIRDCTYFNENRYFSYRRDYGRTGRMLAMIQIK